LDSWRGGSGRLFIFFVFGAVPILFKSLLFAVLGNAWIVNGWFVFVYTSRIHARTQSHTEIEGYSREAGKTERNKKQPE
jgi:hypothetical protein